MPWIEKAQPSKLLSHHFLVSAYATEPHAHGTKSASSKALQLISIGSAPSSSTSFQIL